MNETLDPENWEDFRALLHAVADACVDHLQNAREHGWRPVPESVRSALRLEGAKGLDETAREMVNQVLPYGSGNTHPRFFGWVQGTGNAAALVAELVAAAMNSNCGGRDHGAVYVEREVIRWCAECFGFPSSASGVLVSGTSQATVLAFATARQAKLGDATRKAGISSSPRLGFYAAKGVHNAVHKALELVGVGSDSLRLIPVDERGGLVMNDLIRAVEEDRKAGVLPCCVVGTAGSVDRGGFDPLEEMAAFCREEGLWLHVDGAFGAWTRIAGAPWERLVRGIERADSLALDFHKWMFVQYDCGLLLVRDHARHRATFAARPSYLEGQEAGLGGGDPWFCDYGVDLSRSFRALKVWATLRAYGPQQLGRVIAQNCEQARFMGELVERSPALALGSPVISNVCCFSAVNDPQLNARVVQSLQLKGRSFFSTTSMNGGTVIRAAFTNHRTRTEDVAEAISDVERELALLSQTPSR